MERFKDFLRYVVKYKNSRIDRIMFYLSLICIGLVILHVGYITDASVALITEKVIKGMFYGLFTLVSMRTVATIFVERHIKISQISSIILIAYFVFISLARLDVHSFFAKQEWIYLGIAILFLLELSRNSLFFDNFYFNPTILFVISFIALILLGTVLLMLPRTSLGAPLGFVDALFMASSAVCITGLSVVDLANSFSLFGQTVVMLLIQVGGLGIMTFTGFFGYFFSGGFSYKNQLMFGEILGENKLNDVISTLLTIIFITLFFELIGGLMIFASLDAQQFDTLGQRIFFSAFHAISSFCNSGFSILPDGINNPAYRFNYAFQLCLASIFILGGLGFGTVYNFYTYGKHAIKHFVRHRLLGKTYTHKAQIFSFNTRFILLCNIIVLVLATTFYFFLEQKSTLLDDRSLFGEWVTSFFMANSSRSAGFNSIHVNFVTSPTLIMLVILMWVGASPGSTGGGVKVTTVALAVLNIFALARGKESVEIHKRRVAPESINKAFAIIVLSVLTIAISFVLLNFSDGEKPMKELLFEAVSAYTTCGLSMGVTHSLSPIGKMIIIFTMFVGRVGMLTLLVAFIKNTKNKSYTYPTEKILF